MKFIQSGLYGLTDYSLPSDDDVLAKSECLLKAGLGALQYRDKKARKNEEKIQIATALQELCKYYNTPFIINDDIELARSIQPDGMHLGKDDASINETREYLGPLIIGCSCYNRVDMALAAQQQGADYVAFGSFYTSATKPEAIEAKPDTLIAARRQLKLPIVAIGGITPNNGKVLLEAGADILAASNVLYASGDYLTVLDAFNRLFNTILMEPET